MSSNADKIFAQYGGYDEDGRSARSRSQRLEFHYTEKAMGEFINKDSRVLEIGCATGYYAMHFADKCKEYVGVDLFPPHIDAFNKKIKDNNLSNVSCMVGDATNLVDIASDSFDVVCCFGPMYHLPPDERELVFKECSRVCKPGGVIAFAYINKIGVYAGACVLYPTTYPTKETNKPVLRLGTDDLKPDFFYYTMPEEIEEAAKHHKLIKIRSMAVDFFFIMDIINKMDDDKFTAYMELADEMVKYESCAGMGNHALLICRK